MTDLQDFLRAAAFAARKHRLQKRKDAEASPYINHPLEVAAILAGEGGVTDPVTLVAAVLHDTLEDTETTPEDLATAFSPTVRDLVQELTDDKRLPKPERKARQVAGAPTCPPGRSRSGSRTRSPTSGTSPTIPPPTGTSPAGRRTSTGRNRWSPAAAGRIRVSTRSAIMSSGKAALFWSLSPSMLRMHDAR
jgi:hypothetical protein